MNFRSSQDEENDVQKRGLAQKVSQFVPILKNETEDKETSLAKGLHDKLDYYREMSFFNKQYEKVHLYEGDIENKEVD